jgi:hypothetical protein
MMNQGPKKTEDSAEVEVEVEAGGVVRNAPRKTLAGRVIGYTGMDPPPAFDSIIEDPSSAGTAGDAGEDGGEVSLSRADIEMIEYERIKSLRRKRGTLKRNHKPQPQEGLLGDGVED